MKRTAPHTEGGSERRRALLLAGVGGLLADVTAPSALKAEEARSWRHGCKPRSRVNEQKRKGAGFIRRNGRLQTELRKSFRKILRELPGTQREACFKKRIISIESSRDNRPQKKWLGWAPVAEHIWPGQAPPERDAKSLLLLDLQTEPRQS